MRPGHGYPGPNFPLSGKVLVNGPHAHPLYQWLRQRAGAWAAWTDQAWLTSTASKTLAVTKGQGDEVPWNFHKFLVHRDGRTVQRFASNTQPLDATLTGAIEAALAAPRPN